jgi:hypothetical protein
MYYLIMIHSIFFVISVNLIQTPSFSYLSYFHCFFYVYLLLNITCPSLELIILNLDSFFISINYFPFR